MTVTKKNVKMIFNWKLSKPFKPFKKTHPKCRFPMQVVCAIIIFHFFSSMKAVTDMKALAPTYNKCKKNAFNWIETMKYPSIQFIRWVSSLHRSMAPQTFHSFQHKQRTHIYAHTNKDCENVDDDDNKSSSRKDFYADFSDFKNSECNFWLFAPVRSKMRTQNRMCACLLTQVL